jgi:formylmethanofuran dehydrogenase subunit C
VSGTHLRLREPVTLPVEAEAISPDRLAGLTEKEVAALPVLRGRRWLRLDDLFQVNSAGSDQITVEGNLQHVKRIGQGMTGGRITICGDAGMHLGAGMAGGEIEVHGNVGAWAGAEMEGGRLRVHGDAGPLLGGAYPGEARGMRGGLILVDGNAGPRAGERMRRGLIAIAGNAAEFTGARLIAGSIFVLGRLGPRPGAGMKRGSIVALGGLEEGLLPTFAYDCTYRPDSLLLYLRRLQALGLPIQAAHVEGSYQRYSGDINTVGKGEILAYDQP